MVQQCSQQRPVQNSEVYVLRQVPPFPPLSPPSPITPAEDFDDAPIDARSLTQPDIAVCGKKLAIEERLSRAVHVLATEAAALQNLTQLYSSDRVARDGFTRAVDAITARTGTNGGGGKLVVIGVGKSGHIAKKLVATFNSLAIQAVFLHPTEALHGDLGQISRHDTLLLITFSGKTPELLTLLPHLDKSLPLILLTSHTRPETCDIIRHHRPDTILLPAPVHEAETASFGVAAPTTSTTVALTVGDALAVVASREMYPCVAAVFARNHPGGAIGAALWRQQNASQREEEDQEEEKEKEEEEEVVRAVMVPLGDIAPLPSPSHEPGSTSAPLTGLDVLRAGYASPSGWVRLPQDLAGNGVVVSPRKIRGLQPGDMGRTLLEGGELRWLGTRASAFIPVAADTSVRRAAEWIRGLRAATASASVSAGAGGAAEGRGSGSGSEGAYGDEAIVAVMERGECVGLLEVGRLLEGV
ncbi:hypothetical protein C8A01DRAFT_15821 [Parachaetomium inaequale]|uniref:SIS domain-containing protein n=1 Tax=Parachaetomium inaequale TaxID=2588326 RepID=A0AAN6PKS1_9PEZI|nr:hypothetical protein C8A01DRAFT_15821 [Parachaetomium inaequale]